MGVNLNLGTIDWTAISAIATFIMVIATFVTIYFSIKQSKKSREFQIRLIKQQQAQQKLDDMVNNVLEINNNINPFHVLYYSNKLIDNTFTADDSQTLEKLAVDDNLNNMKLNLQMIRLDNYTSAKSLLSSLNKIRADYGLWARTVNTLFKYKSSSKNAEQPVDIEEQLVVQITTGMINKCIEINPELKSIISVLESGPRPIDKAEVVLKTFETVIAKYIQTKQREFETKLIQFVKSEQQRIDDIVTDK